MVDKILFVIDFPFKWLRTICIPPCEEEEYDNNLVVIWPFCGILVVEMIIKMKWPVTLGFYYYLPIACLWAYAFRKWGDPKNPTKITNHHLLVSIVGMLCGFIWTYYVSGLLIDILTMIGVLTGLKATYLALTVIAIGNALPDALITIALAKKG